MNASQEAAITADCLLRFLARLAVLMAGGHDKERLALLDLLDAAHLNALDETAGPMDESDRFDAQVLELALDHLRRQPSVIDELRHQVSKAAHGCYDVTCPICD